MTGSAPALERLPQPPARTLGATLASIVVVSLTLTTLLGLAAGVLYLTADTPFLLTFIYLRWSAVLVLLLVPGCARLFPSLPIPAVLRTPLTALALSIESILVDIVAAQLH